MAALVYVEVPLRLDTAFHAELDFRAGQQSVTGQEWTQTWTLDSRILLCRACGNSAELTMVSLAYAADEWRALSADDVERLECSSRLRLTFHNHIVPRVGFFLEEAHFTLFFGTSDCTVYRLRFALAESLRGDYERDVTEVTHAVISSDTESRCFEVVGRDESSTYACFGSNFRAIRFCILSNSSSDAEAQELRPGISISKALSALWRNSGQNIVYIRSCGEGVVITLCEKGDLVVWDLPTRQVVYELKSFSGPAASSFLEVSSAADRLFAVGCEKGGAWTVSVYHLLDREVALLTKKTGEGQLVSLAFAQAAIFVLWRSKTGKTSLEAVALEAQHVSLLSIQDEGDTLAALEDCASGESLLKRATGPKRFSQQCTDEATERVGGVSLHFPRGQLEERAKELDPRKTTLASTADLLTPFKLPQNYRLSSALVSIGPDSSSFPPIITYDDHSLGFLLRPLAKADIESLEVECMTTRLLPLLLSDPSEFQRQIKIAGVPRLTLAFAIARTFRKSRCAVLPATSYAKFAETMRDLKDAALPSWLKSTLLAVLTPKSLSELGEYICSLARMGGEPRPSTQQHTQWPAAGVALISATVQRSLQLKAELALDCLLLADWSTAGSTERAHALQEIERCTSALHTAARLHSLHVWLSSPARSNSPAMQSLCVYFPTVPVLALLLYGKAGRLLGASDQFDPAGLSAWISQSALRVADYFVSTEDSTAPRCCRGLLKAGQHSALLGLLDMLPATSATIEYLRGLGSTGFESRQVLCKAMCLLNRLDSGQFVARPWKSACSLDSESVLYQFYKSVTDKIAEAELKKLFAAATFFLEATPSEKTWTHLFYLYVRLRRHSDVYTLLVHLDNADLSECMLIWLREMLREGSVAALFRLPLQPDIMQCALSMLERICTEAPFDLPTVLRDPRYREHSAAMFSAKCEVQARGALSPHFALYLVSLNCLQYRTAAWAMYTRYEDIARETKTASEQRFVWFLCQEALLLAVTALNSLPEDDAWFLLQQPAESRRLVHRAEVQRLLCSIREKARQSS